MFQILKLCASFTRCKRDMFCILKLNCEETGTPSAHAARAESRKRARYAASEIESKSSARGRDLEGLANSGSPPGFLVWLGAKGDLRSDWHTQKYCTPL